VRLDEGRRDQSWVEVQVREEESRGGEGLEGEVEGGEAGLKGAECLAREGAVRLVPGLLSVCAPGR